MDGGDRAKRAETIAKLEQAGLPKLFERFADRGLTLTSYDGGCLTLRYDAEQDTRTHQRHAVDREALAGYVREVLRDLPSAAALFSGLQEVFVATPDEHPRMGPLRLTLPRSPRQ
jgi:hypothetical protein